jgi:hypothetical protein
VDVFTQPVGGARVREREAEAVSVAERQGLGNAELVFLLYNIAYRPEVIGVAGVLPRGGHRGAQPRGVPVLPGVPGEGRCSGLRGPDLPHSQPDGKPHDRSLTYDPSAGDGRGRLAVTVDGKPVTLDLGAGHKAGIRFDRFGLVTTWIDGNGQSVYFDDLTYTSEQ